ncbi:hypothetical protein FACS1894190_07880 [Spirochaetia bacterium]|nr:hypothetical protein FACS1894190_07880 [Spirochaetia bacterium]
MGNIVNIRIGLGFAVLTLLALAGCDDPQGKFTDPGPDMSFKVVVNLDPSIRSKFNVVDVFMIENPATNPSASPGATADAKLGRSEGPFSGNSFTVTVPESYYKDGIELIYNVEFQRKKSGFEEVESIKKIPLALNLLKSRYWTKLDTIPPPGGTHTLDVPDDANLVLGYSPGSYQLSDIPGLPLIYFVDINETAIASMGFKVKMAVASLPSDNIANPIGMALEELDWGMILDTASYTPGDPFRIWFIYEQPVGGHACPCSGTCSSSSCPGVSGFPCPYSSTPSISIGGYSINHPYGFAKLVPAISSLPGSTVHVTIDTNDFSPCNPSFVPPLLVP